VPFRLPDGSSVSYIGDGHDGRALGERGQLLTTSGRTTHVKWADGTISPHDCDDIAPVNARLLREAVTRDEFADSLEVGPIVATGLRATYETEGEAGVLNALASSGHLGGFQAIAEEIQGFAEQRIRQDGTFREAAAQLDEDEVDGLIRVAALVLLRDAFGTVDE
jgi:hypothetical protein